MNENTKQNVTSPLLNKAQTDALYERIALEAGKFTENGLDHLYEAVLITMTAGAIMGLAAVDQARKESNTQSFAE